MDKLHHLASDEKRIIIASTNDLHGHYSPLKIIFKDKHQEEEQSTLVGGKSVISHYFEILRKNHKNVLLVDSGNIFADGMESQSVKEFYENNHYDAITVGLRDFNIKIPPLIKGNAKFFEKFSKDLKVPVLISNLYDLKTARTVEWKGTSSHIMKELDGIKIGIIGLIPDDVVAKTPVDNRLGLYVEDMLLSTMKHARLLRSLGAHIIITLTNQGIDCNSMQAESNHLPVSKVNFDPNQNKFCDLDSPLGLYLKRLPPNLVDVVIGGRTNQKIANYVNGVLVMAGYEDGKSFNYAEFVIDSVTKKINFQKSVVHQPIYFCSEFFKETNDCFTEDQSINHKSREPAYFLGEKISTNKELTYQKEISRPQMKEITKNLTTFNADLSFVSESSRDTQLMIVKLSGGELAKILEEDYNQNKIKEWQPNPFILRNNELRMMISGNEIMQNKTYKILGDLESLQKHKDLENRIFKF
jgi:2',3'-cyclic-nucleotide 2'-phosphodiesterase (5'-nucleotidase family)